MVRTYRYDRKRFLAFCKDPDVLEREIKALQKIRDVYARKEALVRVRIEAALKLRWSVSRFYRLHDDEPILNWSDGKDRFDLRAGDRDKNKRVAEVYRNVRTKKTWGLVINEYNAGPGGGHRWSGIGHFRGSAWKKQAALLAAMDWIVHGVMPAETPNV